MERFPCRSRTWTFAKQLLCCLSSLYLPINNDKLFLAYLSYWKFKIPTAKNPREKGVTSGFIDRFLQSIGKNAIDRATDECLILSGRVICRECFEF